MSLADVTDIGVPTVRREVRIFPEEKYGSGPFDVSMRFLPIDPVDLHGPYPTPRRIWRKPRKSAFW